MCDGTLVANTISGTVARLQKFTLNTDWSVES